MSRRASRLDRLVEAAAEVRRNAYAPYSKYAVGAAIESASGAVYVGCNVENSSYGATLCAERNAIAQMIAAGERVPVACAIVTGGETPGSPCGICRQVLFELADDLPIVLAAVPAGARSRERDAHTAAHLKMRRVNTTLAKLLPLGFHLGRKRRSKG